MPVVQSGENATQTTTNPTVVLTGCVAGNYLACFAAHESGVDIPAISTTVGTTAAWTSEIAETTADFVAFRMAYTTVTTSGDITIQAARVSGSAFAGLIVVEVDNIDSFLASSPLASVGADPRVSALETPAAYDATLIGFALDWSGGAPPTVTAGWTDEIVGMAYGAIDTSRATSRLYTSGDAQASFGGFATDPVFVAHMLFEETAGVTALTASGTPDLEVITASGVAGIGHDASGTPSVALITASGVAALASPVNITVVDGDNAWTDGDSGLIITGTGFI